MKLVLLLGTKLAKYAILEKVMKEFKARGLDVKYAEQIKGWKKYKREKKFAKKLDKKMDKHKEYSIKQFKEEIKKWTPLELEEFVIEGLDCLKKI